MMKNWNIPTAVVQEFAANEYVSACTATIDCNVALEEGFSYYHHAYDEPMMCATKPDPSLRTFGYYSPCSATHDVSIHGELDEHTFYEGYQLIDGKYVKAELSAPVDCYVWFEMDEAGIVQSVHATRTRDGFVSNKS